MKNNLQITQKFPHVWIYVFFVLITTCLLWYIFNLRTDLEIQSAKQQQKIIIKQIDSLATKRTFKINNVLKTSQTNAVRAINLIKNLSNEKTIIRDTSNASMRRYLTDYKPE